MINKMKIEDAGQIVMPAGKLLVVAMKERKHTVTRPIPVPNEDKDYAEGEMPENKIEMVKNREPYYVQFYKVISAPEKEEEYVVGSIILAPYTAGATFDLISKAKILNKFEILGLFVENIS